MTNAHGTKVESPFTYSARATDADGWRPPEPKGTPKTLDGPYGYPFRTCWYCGSMHPDDLLEWLRSGHVTTLGEADWKYGFPHKVYVDGIPNPKAGKKVNMGARLYTDEHGVRRHDITWGPAPEYTFAKFYTVHLADATDFEALANEMESRIPNVHWEREEDGRVKWSGHRGQGVW